jgi:hypothetical protein
MGVGVRASTVLRRTLSTGLMIAKISSTPHINLKPEKSHVQNRF